MTSPAAKVAPSTFLDKEEIHKLTGTRIRSKQTVWLRMNAFRFWVNVAGVPVVPRSAIDGVAAAPEPAPEWQPNALRRAA